jgi:hypothetical protein
VVDFWSTSGPPYPIPLSVDQYDDLVSDVGYDVSFGTPAKSSYLRCISAMTFRRRGGTSYLLTKSDSNDGYDAVLHEVWGKKKGLPDINATRAAALSASATRPKFGIVAAIRAQAGKVSYKQPPKIAGDDARTIIELLNDYDETFYAAMKGVDADVWSKSFRRWLGTDDPPAKDEPPPIPPEVDEARKKVRAFLRQLPAVNAYAIEIEKRKKGEPNEEKKGTSIWDEPLKAAKDQLKALQKTLVDHELVFLYRRDYARWFDMAARGIPGWFPPYPDR